MKITDLTLLEAFLAVAGNNSFSKASEKLNLSLPNVSKKVQQLESELGVKLFHRTTRSVSLTSDGESFLVGAKVILDDMEVLQSSFTQSNELSGEIRIACLPSVAIRWLPDILISFQKLYPKVTFNIEASDRIVDLVNERIDVAIRVQTPKESDLIFRKLAENQLVLVASPRYLKEFGTPGSIRDLNKHSVLMLASYERCKFVANQIPLSALVNKQLFNSDSGIFLTEMALAGAGIAVRSAWDVSKLLKDKKLIRVLPNASLEKFGDLYLVTASKVALNRRTSAFVDYAKDKLGKNCSL
jgi:DNA-binding transcriptional LysR family regulator